MSSDRSLFRAGWALMVGAAFLQAQSPAGYLQSQKSLERVNNALAHLARAPGDAFNINEAATALADYAALPAQDVGQALGGATGLAQIRRAARYYASLPSDVQEKGMEAGIEGYKWIAEMLAESPKTLKILGIKVLDLAGGSADVLQGGLDATDGYVDGNKTKVEQGLLDAASALVPGTPPIALLKALAEGALRESFHQQGLSKEQIDERIDSIELPAFDAGLNTFSGDWLSAPGQPQTIRGVIISAIKLAINNVTGGGLAGADAINQFLASQQGQEILQSAIEAARAGANTATGGGVTGAENAGDFIASGKAAQVMKSAAGAGLEAATGGGLTDTETIASSVSSPRNYICPSGPCTLEQWKSGNGGGLTETASPDETSLSEIIERARQKSDSLRSEQGRLKTTIAEYDEKIREFEARSQSLVNLLDQDRHVVYNGMYRSQDGEQTWLQNTDLSSYSIWEDPSLWSGVSDLFNMLAKISQPSSSSRPTISASKPRTSTLPGVLTFMPTIPANAPRTASLPGVAAKLPNGTAPTSPASPTTVSPQNSIPPASSACAPGYYINPLFLAGAAWSPGQSICMKQ